MDRLPKNLTILGTYKCTAECKECCFQSSPRLTQRLTIDQIKKSIVEAKSSFPSIEVVIFSGGEIFLLKEDLYQAIDFANKQGLSTRCVTNAFWGKSPSRSEKTVERLLKAGLTEINISTGSDHQEYVPFSSVENASQALVKAGIRTVVTIEADKSTTDCYGKAMRSTVFSELISNYPDLFWIQCNSWMPFSHDYEERESGLEKNSIFGGCDQLFSNIVITPYGKIAACCGLTFEHIPEMTLGDIETNSMIDLYTKSQSDFMKIWLKVDGPATILRRLYGEEVEEELSTVKHICQACVVLHKHPKVRNEIKKRYKEFVPEVLARYAFQNAVIHKLGGSTHPSSEGQGKISALETI